MNQEIITVTGSTGNIGTELINQLSEANVPIRAVLRNLKNARKLPNIVWVQADLADEQLLEAVLAGTDKLFLLTGNRPGFGAIQVRVIETAERLGLKHVVKLSALGASPRTKSGLAKEHYDAEQALENSSMDWTILRPHVFMQNWLGDLAETVQKEGAIYSAVGDGIVPFIDARDIAAVAAQVLLNPEKHRGKTYVLTGGKAVGYAELARSISKATGEKVVYHALSMEEMRARMEKQGLDEKMIDSLLALSAYQKAGGKTAQVSENVEEILGRKPRTIQDFARDYKDSFIQKIKPTI